MPGCAFERVTVLLSALCLALPFKAVEAQETNAGLNGRVIDSTEQPIKSATVIVVGEPTRFMPSFRSRGKIKTSTNAAGEFSLEFEKEHLPILSSYQPKIRVVAWAPQQNLLVKQFPSTRMMSDAPLELVLEESLEAKIKVQTPDGVPLANAVVSPAKVSGMEFAFGELDFLNAKTDANGSARISGIDPHALEQIYVQSEEHGNQSLALTASKRSDAPYMEAVLLKTHLASTEFAFDKPDPTLDMEQIAVSFVSKPREGGTDFVWHEVFAQKDGKLEQVRIAAGQTEIRLDMPGDFPFAATEREIQKDGKLQPISIEKASLVSGKVVDAKSGDGLPGIHISQFRVDWRLTFTNSNGEFGYWVSSQPSDGFYPHDPLGKHVSSLAFYTRPEALPDENGIIDAGEHKLDRMPCVVGKVIDQAGKPVAAAKVTVSHQVGRFTYSVALFTDNDGRFQLYHIAEGTQATLSAATEELRTANETDILLEDGKKIELKAVPIIRRSFSGHIVDAAGRPVANAAIKLKKTKISVAENYSGADRIDEPIFDSSTTIRTDGKGYFESPPTGADLTEVAFDVEAKGFRKYHSPWLQVERTDGSGATEERVELKLQNQAFRLQQAATKQTCEINVVSVTEQKLSGIRLVSLGSHSGLKKLQPNTSQFEAELLSGAQVLAVTADGHFPSFHLLDRIPKNLDVQLHSSNENESNFDLKNARADESHRKQLAVRLIEKLAKIDKSDTVFKRRLHFETMVYATPAKALALFESGEASEFEMMINPAYSPISPDFLRSILPNINTPQVSTMLKLHLAKLQDDEASSQQLMQAAIDELSKLSGSEKAIMASRVASALVSMDRKVEAKQLIESTWQELSSLQDFVREGTRDDKSSSYRGVCRFFGPELALADKRAAMKLIELGAFSNEIQWLQSEAAVFLANQGDTSWRLVVKAYLDGQINGFGLLSFLRKARFTDVEQGTQLAESLESSNIKAFFLSRLAQQNEIGQDKELELFERVLENLKDAQFQPGHPHPAFVAAEASRVCFARDKRLSDNLCFQALWLGEGTGSILPFDTICALARELAVNRPELARCLIEESVKDWSWLYNVRNSELMFQNNRPLEVAGVIDPNWAYELATELMESQLSGQRSRRIATVHCLINSWARDALNMSPPF